MSNQNPHAHSVELIRTVLQTRGAGVESDPTRTIEQFWTPDGKLAAENDPFHPNETACKEIKVVLKDRKFPPTDNHSELPETVRSALDSLQEMIDCQKETIVKLQAKIHECDKAPKAAPKRKKATS